MTHSDNYTDWRDEHGIKSRPYYVRKFAIRSVVCSDGVIVRMKHYYKKYICWTADYIESKEYGHIDFIENVSEEDYIVRKLSENL